jgi:tetratricopeptide (TPR) repeat protein
MDLIWLAAFGVVLLLAGAGTLLYDRMRRQREIESLLNREVSTNMLDDTAIQPRIVATDLHPDRGRLFPLSRLRGLRLAQRARSLGTMSQAARKTPGRSGAKAPNRLARFAALTLPLCLCLAAATALLVTRAEQKQDPGGVVMAVCDFAGAPVGSSLSRHLADYVLKASAGDLPQLAIRASSVRPATPEQAEAERARIKADFLWWGEVGPSGALTVGLAISTDFVVGQQPWQVFSDPDVSALLFPQHSEIHLPTSAGTDPLVPLSIALAHLKAGNYAAASRAAYGARATLDEAQAVGGIARFTEAAANVTTGDYASANDLYSAMESRDDLVPEALVNRGYARLMLGDPSGAMADADRAIAVRDTSSRALSRAYLLRARVSYRQGNMAQAAHDLDESARLDAHYLPTRLMKAETLYRQAQADAARAELEWLIHRAPDAAPAYRQMALVKMMLAQHEEAQKWLDNAEALYRKWIDHLRGEEAQAQVTGNMAQAQRATDGIVRLNHELAAVYLYRGMAWADVARNEPAETFFGGLWRQIRGQPTTYERAIQNMQQASQLDPNRADVPLRMGEVYASAGDADRAAAAYRNAQTLDPGSPEPYLGLAKLQQAQGKTQEAISTLNQLLGTSPRYYPAYEQLRAIHAALGDEQSARASVQRGAQVEPQTTSDHLWRGKFLRVLGDNAQAAQEFRRAAQDPQLWEAHLYLGEILQEAGQGPEALAEYRQALDKQPNNPTALLHAGQLLVLAGQTDEAETMFKRLTSLSPGNVEGHIAYLRLLLSKGDTRAAIAEGKRAVQADDRRADAHFFLGAAYESEKDWPAATQQYKIATERDPKLSDAFIRLARSLFYEDRYTEALEVSDTAIKMRAGDANAYRWKAEAQHALGYSGAALETLHHALKLSPNYAEAIALAARAFARHGDEQAALQYATRASLAEPRNPIGLLTLGQVHLERGRATDAATAYRAALELAPHSAEALVGLGRAEADRQKALQFYRNALESDRRFAEAHLYAGHTYVEMQRWDDAFREYRSTVQLRPRWPMALYYLGRAYTQRKDLENARSAFLKATQGAPLLVEAWFGLGIVSRDLGRADEAIKALGKATELSSGYAEAWLYLGLTYEESGDRARAAHAFARARDTAADATIRQQAEKGLSRVQ